MSIGAFPFSVKDLSHTYFDLHANTKVHAIDHLTLDVQDGELMCVLGPSGCGKSTMLYVVAGLIKASDGHIMVDEVPVQGPGPDRGMVFQEYALLPWKTVRENINLGLRIQKVPKEERAQRIKRIIELGLSSASESVVHKGLDDGDKLIVAGQHLVSEGAPVKIVEGNS